MDAKPHRPLRGVPLSTIGNENAGPANQPANQRHKSVGNLKNMATNGFNAGAKRTVFGDLSNNSRAVVEIYPGDKAKDRVATVNHRDLPKIDKENVPSFGNEAFLRPAQRPSAFGSKQLLGAPQSTNPIFPTALNPPARAETKPDPVSKPAISKKPTVVFNDQKNIVHLGSNLDLPGPTHHDHHRAAMADPPVNNPRHHKSQPQLKSEQPALRRTQSRLIGRFSEPAGVDNDCAEAPFEDALEDLSHLTKADQAPRAGESHPVTSEASKPAESHPVAFTFLPPSKPTAVTKPLPAGPPPADNASAMPPSVPPHQSQPAAAAISTSASAHAQASVPEPEEFWDEDEDDFDDEHGFTTAHSYRSHGDNTTCGATTILAPKVTAKVRKELEMAKAYVESLQTEDEVEEEAWDVSMVAEYGEEIFEYMRNLEAKMLPNPHYMDIQTEIQWSMRSILIDWLVQVHHRFALLPETLFLAVNCVDRFLSVKIVSLGKLQLVGATAIFVAAKYEEINCPSVQEIVYMVDQGFSAEEILKAERFMLSMLQFELGFPGPMSFLRRISKADDYDLETRTLAKYFLEVTIIDERFVGSPSSFLAAGAHCLSLLMLRKSDWTPSHVHYSGYTMSQLRPLVSMILDCCQNASSHHAAVFEKYASSKYKRASTFVESEIKNGTFALPPLAGNGRASIRSLLEDNSTSFHYSSREMGHLIPTES